MAFDNLADFFAMGTHGLYVWSAYGFSVLALILLIWHTVSTRRKIREILRKRFVRSERR